MGILSYEEFSRGKRTPLKHSQSAVQEATYNIEDFAFLKNTRHIDPEELIPYKIIDIFVRKGLLVASRKPLFSKSKTPRDFDIIHALDALEYAKLCDPSIKNPLPSVQQPKKAGQKRKTKGPTHLNNKVPSLIDSEVNKWREDRAKTSTAEREEQYRNLRRSQRLQTLSYLTVFSVDFEPEPEFNLSNVVKTPNTHRQTMYSPQSAKWRQAEFEEMEGLRKARVAIECDLPPGRRAILGKWVFTIKRDSLGAIKRFKARICARGDMEIDGIDYSEVFSPVVSWVGIRIYLALTVLLGLVPLQLDIDLAYLYADLEEEVYMQPPPGVDITPGKVWLLQKSLYGLKQAGRNWNKLLDSTLRKEGFDFKQLETDTCLYIRKLNGKITILFIYVDDIYIAASTKDVLDAFVDNLRVYFSLKILGVPQQLLGVTLSWGRNFSSVHLSSEKTIRELLRDFGMTDCKPASLPLPVGLKLLKSDCIPANEAKLDPDLKIMQSRYRTLVGTFIFISYTVRADIAYATQLLCRSMANPGPKHYEAAIHVLRYLAGSIQLGIGYRSSGNVKPVIYADSDDGSDESRKSTAGHIVFFADGPIAWKAELINAYSLSTCESEIRAINAAFGAIKTACYLTNLMNEILGHIDEHRSIRAIPLNLEIDFSIFTEPISIQEDNKAAVDWSKKATGNSKMKHIEKALLWIKREVEKGTITLVQTPTKDQIADIFTKILAIPTFYPLVDTFMFYFKYD